MKIHGPTSHRPLEKLQGSARESRAAAPSGERAEKPEQVLLSDTARFIQELHQSAARAPAIRESEVERARQDIASGKLDSDAEIAAAVDGFLASLA